MAEQNLKDCPWCGHARALGQTRRASGSLTISMIHCNGCGAEGPVDSDDAANAWNTRTLASSPTAADLDKDAEIARLREALEKIARAKMLVGWDGGPSVCYAAETAGRARAALTKGQVDAG